MCREIGCSNYVAVGILSGYNIITTMFDDVLHCFGFVFPFRLVSLHVEVYTVGFSPRHYIVAPMLFPSGNPSRYHEEVSSLQSMIPPKRFDTFPP